MKYLASIFLLSYCTLTISAQGDFLELCIVLELDISEKSDLLKASFQFPIMMGRSDKNNPKKKIPHYFINLPNGENSNLELKHGLNVVGIRPYNVEGKSLDELATSLASNEIAFFVAPHPGLGDLENDVVASFPSTNNELVKTDHLIISESLPLSEKLVKMLKLPFDALSPGIYPILRKELKP